MEANHADLILRNQQENANIVDSKAFKLLRIFNKEFLLTKKILNYDKLDSVLVSMSYNIITEYDSETVFY